MKLGSLKILNKPSRNKKRVGRGHGSGLGRTSGRGEKGYHSRSGSKHRPWFEGGQMPLHRRVPKRGFTSRTKNEFQIVNLSQIESIDSPEISPSILKKFGIIKYSLRPVKILAHGELSKIVNLLLKKLKKMVVRQYKIK